MWTYCHMSYQEPGIQPGIAVSAGQPVGLVGSTGHSTGPHLHLQLQPTSSYPQVEPWFEAFAGTAFRWQDAPTMAVGPVFDVVGGVEAAPSDDPAVITFTRRKVLTPWPSLPKSEVWLCGSVSSSPGFLRSQSSRCSRPRR